MHALRRDTIIYGAFYPIKDLELYNFGYRSKYHICRFEEIGWPDPFPTAQRVLHSKFKEPAIYDVLLKEYNLNTNKYNKKVKIIDFV